MLHLQQGGNVPSGTHSDFTYRTAPGTTITGYFADLVTSTAPAYDQRLGSVEVADDDGSVFLRAGEGTRSGSISATGRTTQSIVISARCDGPAGQTCWSTRLPSDPVTAMADARIGPMRIRTEDPSSPTVSDVSGTAQSATRWEGAQTLNFTATDSGLGVKDVEVVVDGEVRTTKVLDANGGRCIDRGEKEYDTPLPCPTSVSAYETIDTSNFPEGTHSVAVNIADAAGNRTAVLPARTVQIDNVPPPGAPTDIWVLQGSGWQFLNKFEIYWTNPTGPYVIVKANYLLCPGTDPSAGDCVTGSQSGNMISSLHNLSVPAPGVWSLWLTVEDESGPTTTTSSADPIYLRFDPERPQPPTATRSNDWLSAAQADVVQRSIAPPASLPASGIAGYSYTTNGATPDPSIDIYGSAPTLALTGLPDGATSLKIRAVSGAGVASSEVDTSTINIDREPPQVSFAGAAPERFWLTDRTALAADGADQATLSGMAPAATSDPAERGGTVRTRVDGGPWRTERGAHAPIDLDEGRHVVSAQAFDLAGNPSSVKTVTVGLDTQPPVVGRPALRAGGTTLIVPVSDATSGVAAVSATVRSGIGDIPVMTIPARVLDQIAELDTKSLSLRPDTYKVEFEAIDAAGHRTRSTTPFDLIVPAIGADPAPPSNAPTAPAPPPNQTPLTPPGPMPTDPPTGAGPGRPTPAACSKACVMQLTGSIKTSSAGRSIRLRLVAGTAIGKITFTLPAGVARLRRLPVALTQATAAGRRRTAKLQGNGPVLRVPRSKKDTQRLVIRGRQVHISGLSSGTRTVELVLPVSAKSIRLAAGRQVMARAGAEVAKATLPRMISGKRHRR